METIENPVVVVAAPVPIKISRKKTRLSYAKLVQRAISSLTDSKRNQDAKKAASYQAICKYIAGHWTVPETFKRHVSKSLKELIAQKKLSTMKRSYKLVIKETKRKIVAKKAEEKNKRQRAVVVAVKRAEIKPIATMDIEIPKAIEELPKKKAVDAPKNLRLHKAEKEAKTTHDAASIKKSAVKQAKFDHIWQYFHNGWKNYDISASDTIEEVYQKYLANRGDNDVRAVKSGQWEYQVDFMAMKQTNIQHPSHTVRNIRRAALSA